MTVNSPLASRNHRTGFTLVETMVAAALTLMMVGIVAGMIGNLSGQVQQVRTANTDRHWQEQLARQLQNEFCHCLSVIVDATHIKFDSLATCDSSSGLKTHEPARIVYQIRQRDPADLFRTESRLLARIEETTKTSFVCFGLTRFELLTQLETDVPPGSLRMRVHFVDQVNQLPDSFEVTLFRHGVRQ